MFSFFRFVVGVAPARSESSPYPRTPFLTQLRAVLVTLLAIVALAAAFEIERGLRPQMGRPALGSPVSIPHPGLRVHQPPEKAVSIPAEIGRAQAKSMEQLRADLGVRASTGTLREALTACATNDPSLAIALAQAWARTDDERYHLAAAVVKKWIRTAPRTAWAWARENSARLSPPGETTLASLALQSLAADDPKRMLSLLDESAASGKTAEVAAWREEAVIALVTTGHVDLARDTLTDWTRDSATAAIDSAGLTMVALALAAHESPEAAADWLTRLPTSAACGSAAVSLAAEWAEKQPASALEWAGTLSNPEARAAAMSRAFAVWAEHEPNGATTWFLDHDALLGAEADAMISNFIAQSHLEPSSAVQWAALVRDETVKQQSLDLVISQWASSDRPGALRYLTEIKILSDEQRLRLLALFGGAQASVTTD